MRANGSGYRCDMAISLAPFAAEVRVIRDELAAECGYDIRATRWPSEEDAKQDSYEA